MPSPIIISLVLSMIKFKSIRQSTSQKVCEKLTYDDCRDGIEKFLETSIGKKPISFKIFSKTLNQRLFEFFYGALQRKFFLQKYGNFFLNRKSTSSLLKRPNATKSWYTLRNQFEEAYGKTNLLCYYVLNYKRMKC